MTPTAKRIEANIRKLGFKPKGIKTMLTCHARVDHVGTLQEVVRCTGGDDGGGSRSVAVGR